MRTTPWLTVAVAAIGLTSLPSANAEDHAFTVLLDAGEEQCFFQEVRAVRETLLDMEFQVTGGASFEVDFTVTDPSGVVVSRGLRRRDGVYEKEDPAAGVWKFCFDNRFALMAEKSVFFMLSVDYPEKATAQGKQDEVDHSLDFMQETADRISHHLRIVERVQSHLRARESRHRETVENSLRQVSIFSSFEIAMIILIGVVQVIAIRKLFGNEDNSKPSL